jgi:hypothetical protein
MRLVSLEPRWISRDGRVGLGVSFLCPRCKAQRLFVAFETPLDGGAPLDESRKWQRTGDTFDTLTLTPSIDASQSGHWHGWVEAGEVR